MKYLLLIYENEASFTGVSEAEQGKIFQEYMDYTNRIQKHGNYLAGEALQPVSTATTVRVKDGRTVTTDGPFAETREQLGGFYMVEAGSRKSTATPSRDCIRLASPGDRVQMMPRAVSGPPQGLQPACMFAWLRHRVGLRIHGGQLFDGSDHGTKGFLVLATL